MRLVLLAASLALVACAPPPKQYGGLIPIDTSGVAWRLASMCRFSSGELSALSCAEPEELER